MMPVLLLTRMVMPVSRKGTEKSITDSLGHRGMAIIALWFNRGTGPKPEIQCFSGLYLRFY